MKICKHCNAEVEDQVLVCPECGADMLEDETPAQETPVQETPAAPEKPEPPKKKTPWGLIAGLAAAALVVVGLIVWKSHADQQPAPAPDETLEAPVETPDAPADPAAPAEPQAPAELPAAHHVNGYGFPSYSIYMEAGEDGAEVFYYQNENAERVELTREEVDALLDQVVATCGDDQLTNRDLFYYNDQQFYAFYQMYGQMLGYMMDTSKAMDEQLNLEGTGTWQQFFVDAGADLYSQVAALYQEAKKVGHTMTEAEQANLDLALDLEDMAAENGFASIDELLQNQMSPAATLETYRHFLEINSLASSYANYLADQIVLTDEEVEAYFDENADLFLQQYNVQKVDKPNVNVRHILISPEQTTAEDGSTSITDEAWAAAEAAANEIYEGWKNGEATEDAFAALAAEHTQDPGSQATGGLYENVAPGQMVPEFDQWCFEDGRKTGDSGVVKTQFGYHIMYYVDAGEEIQWRTMAEQSLLGERAMAARQEIQDRYESTQDLSKGVLVLAGMGPTDPNAVEIPMGDSPVTEPAE